MPFRHCPFCNRTVEVNIEHGSVTCMECARVIAAGEMIASHGFTETKAGTIHAVGKRVGPSDIHASRARTLLLTRQRLEIIGSRLLLGPTQIDCAVRCYGLALTNHRTYGRSGALTRAVCIYIACRQFKTSHLLLDVAWAANVEVFALARAYLRFCNENGINHAPVDPTLYIPRTLSRLGIENSQQSREIQKMATIYCGVMKRDYLELGRRPVGVTGAAVYAALRSCGQGRELEEVAVACNIGLTTLAKRVHELASTEAASLTIGQLRELSEDGLRALSAQAPPSFRRRNDLPASTDLSTALSPAAVFDLQQDEALIAGELVQGTVDVVDVSGEDIQDVQRWIVSTPEELASREKMWAPFEGIYRKREAKHAESVAATFAGVPQATAAAIDLTHAHEEVEEYQEIEQEMEMEVEDYIEDIY